jgi:hypothetical protein
MKGGKIASFGDGKSKKSSSLLNMLPPTFEVFLEAYEVEWNLTPTSVSSRNQLLCKNISSSVHLIPSLKDFLAKIRRTSPHVWKHTERYY